MVKKTWVKGLTLGQVRVIKGLFTFWPPEGTYTKRVDGKRFRLYATNPVKAEARALADIIRKRGYPARVTKSRCGAGWDYSIWVGGK